MTLKTELSEELADYRDSDLIRRDAWVFGPLIAIVVALPLAITILFGASLWYVAQQKSLDVATQPAPTTFAARWVELGPDGRAMN